MLGKWMLTITAVITVIIGLLVGYGLFHGEDNPEDPDDFKASDASEIAASFSAGYSGFFGENFYLDGSYSKSDAVVFYYPDDDSMATVEFFVLKDQNAAKAKFSEAKTKYSSAIGRIDADVATMGVYERGSLSDAMGYYSNLKAAEPSSFMYYSGYYGNAYFDSYVPLGKYMSSSNFPELCQAIYHAITNPVSVDKAKIYTEIPDENVTCRLLVYGNADNNNYLNNADISLIQKIIRDGNWNSVKDQYPYADANCDGKLDSKDVELVGKFIAGESATMYYTDWNLDTSSIKYPLSGKIAGTYDSSLWFAQIVGVYDDVTYLCRTQAYIDGLRGDMFPGAAKNIVAQGTNGNFDPEKLIANNIKVVIGDPFGISAEYLEKISRFSNSGIQNILIPENRDINGLNWSNSVVTLGVMFNKQENTKPYVEYIEKVEKKIADSVAKATESEKDLTYLLIYAQPGSSGVGLDVHSTGTTQYGDVMNIENLPLKCAIQNSSSNWVDSSVENVLALDPDIIIFTAWGPFQNNYTQQEYIDFINEKMQDYKTSSAYKNGQIYAISYEVYGTLPGISGIPYLGSQIWPDLFDEEEGIALLQEYFDKFTTISGTDVTQVPTLLPLTQDEIEGKITKFQPTNRLLVYGNADNNNYLNASDAALIEKIIRDGNWNAVKSKYPYADANCDGKLDSKDVALVNKFIAGESATMYYTDWNLNTSSIKYPLSGKIAGTYDSSLWFAQIVGVYDDVAYLCRTQAYIDGLRGDMFPGAAKNIVAQGTNGNFDPEKLIANNIKVVIGDPFGISAEYLEKISRFSNSGIQNILIPENRDINGLNWSNSVVTLGVMFNKQENTKPYVEYIEKVEKKIADSVAKATESEKDLTYLLIYAQPGSSGVGLDVHSTGTTQYGDVMNIENLPLKCAIQNSSSNWVDSSVENVLALDPDIIIFTAWGPFQNNYTQQEYIDFINEKMQDYKTSSAYKNGQIYAISYEVYGTLPGISGIPYLGSLIWPDLFDQTEGIALLQEYFDKFTTISGTDVTKVPTLLPLSQADIEGTAQEFVAPKGMSESLTVLGNADLDSDIDFVDVRAIEYIISVGGTVSDYPYADANNDGKIDQKDVAFVKDMINQKKQVIYYYNVDNEIASVHYPVTGKIIATYNKTLEAARTLGLSSQVIAIDEPSQHRQQVHAQRRKGSRSSRGRVSVRYQEMVRRHPRNRYRKLLHGRHKASHLGRGTGPFRNDHSRVHHPARSPGERIHQMGGGNTRHGRRGHRKQVRLSETYGSGSRCGKASFHQEIRFRTVRELRQSGRVQHRQGYRPLRGVLHQPDDGVDPFQRSSVHHLL